MVGLFVSGLESFVGILTGGLFSYVNFWGFAAIIQKMFKEIAKGEKLSKKFAFWLVLKILLAYGAVGVLIYFKLVLAEAFVIGVSGLLVSAVIVPIIHVSRQAGKR